MASNRVAAGAGVGDVDLQGKTVLVTGSTGGIGRETALALGSLGARVLVHGRDREAGAAVVEALHEAGAEAEFIRADFASLPDVRDLAEDVKTTTGRLDVLVNNAGGYFREPRLTEAGVEYTFAVNHLAPFLLTNLLIPTLRAAPAGRVVTVSSEAHRSGTLDLDAVESVERYAPFSAYARSKLANVMFTFELARRLDAVTANCLHPGVIPASGFMRNLPLPIRAPAQFVGSVLTSVPFSPVSSVREGAETPVYLAASPEVADVTGRYFDDCQPRRAAAAARDEGAQRRLWEYSAEVTGLQDIEEV
ncbi:SDR family oxidoreductase [Haloarchaeobius amylolyticus]|uniref:SDR family oxidoreductase n=1 Tax=Haloarchaeobius amylolyticus TaxID=1198296 RepID=UPI00227098BA|nr:SDR family oxidoreductase [Haloarchaeobius amylolyticus]